MDVRAGGTVQERLARSLRSSARPALGTLPNREVAQLPDGVDERMMDFALFGEAVRLTLGKEPGTFTKLYAANRAPHSKDIAECDFIWGTR